MKPLKDTEKQEALEQLMLYSQFNAWLNDRLDNVDIVLRMQLWNTFREGGLVIVERKLI